MPVVSRLYFEFEAQWGVENEGVNIHRHRPHNVPFPHMPSIWSTPEGTLTVARTIPPE